MSALNIHFHVTDVYGTEAMSDCKFRKLFKKFKDGRTNFHDEKRSDRSSVITDDLMQAFESVPQVRVCLRYLVLYLKYCHGGKHFSDNEGVKAAVNSWLSDKAADFYEECFQKLVLRYDKCINKLYNCLEK
ncbi:HTH_48 domain-containing protein [Trichonephila clavipes]|nr:HTH_48 domain-containing protein [Trichonephila clavipes]